MCHYNYTYTSGSRARVTGAVGSAAYATARVIPPVLQSPTYTWGDTCSEDGRGCRVGVERGCVERKCVMFTYSVEFKCVLYTLSSQLIGPTPCENRNRPKRSLALLCLCGP
eukprot:2695770-Pyramimonas_sp.AAC.1